MKNMKKLLLKSILIFLFTLGLIIQARAVSFIEGLEDVPVMEGLKQLPHDNISFGNEESRLVEAILTGNKISFGKVQRFYIDTLPQMGWSFEGKSGGSLLFYRDRESLKIIKESVQPLTIRITVTSRN